MRRQVSRSGQRLVLEGAGKVGTQGGELMAWSEKCGPGLGMRSSAHLDELAKSGGVMVASRLSIAKGLQNGVGLQDTLLDARGRARDCGDV